MTRPKPGRRPQYGPALHKLCPSWPSAVPGGGQASEWGPWAPGTRSRAGARAGPESTDGSRPVRPAPATGFVSSSPPRNTASLRPKAVACASKDSRGKRRPARLCRVPVPLVFRPSWTCSFLVTSLPPAALLAAAPSPESTCALPAARKADSESGARRPPQPSAALCPASAGSRGKARLFDRCFPCAVSSLAAFETLSSVLGRRMVKVCCRRCFGVSSSVSSALLGCLNVPLTRFGAFQPRFLQIACCRPAVSVSLGPRRAGASAGPGACAWSALSRAGTFSVASSSLTFRVHLRSAAGSLGAFMFQTLHFWF